MKALQIIAGVMLIGNVLTIENKNKSDANKLGYNPVDILENIFSINASTEPRESRHNNIQFEKDFNDNNSINDQSSKIKFIDENHDYKTEKEKENFAEININTRPVKNDAIKSGSIYFPSSSEGVTSENIENADVEPRSDYIKRKNKKRKPRVQTGFNQIPNAGYTFGHDAGIDTHLLPIGANFRPDTANEYGLYPIGGNNFQVETNYGYAGYYGHGPIGPYPVNAFIPRGIASGAFTAIVDAFTSIAQNDDYQCVPRLLCETAGGAAGSNKILDPVSSLQPLFTMLLNYQGISTSPLFLFGRAVILGMTSKGNPSSCRYAYPQCPNDPDDLVHYLNNHKGGFFRFFSNIHGKPISGQEQNLNSYGIYRPLRINENNYNLYDGNKFYGEKYAYGERNQHDGISTNSISRIQNKPTNDLNNINTNKKWFFPDDLSNSVNKKTVKELKFPTNDYDYVENDLNNIQHDRRGTTVKFPDRNKDDRYIIDFNNNISTTSNYNRYANKEEKDYVYDYVHKFYVKREKKVHATDDGVQTVYIVRGNRDPRYPEVVKLRPGQSVQ